MKENNVVSLNKQVELETDPLQSILKEGARKMLAVAIDAEVESFIEQHSNLKTEDNRAAIVRNGYLPERTIQTGLGDIAVKVPKVRDRSGAKTKFNSQLVPPYLKRAKSIDELLPWLYLRGISTGDFPEALQHLLGANAAGLSANTISRLKSNWEEDYKIWTKRDLSNKRYVYIWVDGVHCNVRMDDRLCLLVVMGADEQGNKELLAISDGYRESSASWEEVLLDITQRGLTQAPKLAIGDGAMGFWNAVGKVWPHTDQQRCWVHKTANVMEKLPKSMQPKVKEALHNIWQAETRDEANRAFDNCIERFTGKYPKAMDCLIKDKTEMLVFYDYPAETWQHIRTTNPIESVFATVRLRTHKMKNCGSRITTLTMAFKLMETAQKTWHRLRGHKHLADVITDVKFIDGIKQTDDQEQDAA